MFRLNLPVDIVGPDIAAMFPSRNSIIAFKVRESASANSQNSFVRPHPSCNSTRIASSSSLHTVRRWFRVFRLKWRKRSQSAHNDWHVSHWIMAAVTPSSWFEHNGRVSDIFDHWPDDNLLESNFYKKIIVNEFSWILRLVHVRKCQIIYSLTWITYFSTWSLSNTHKLANANQSVAVLMQFSWVRYTSSRRVRFKIDSAIAAFVTIDHFSDNFPYL